MRGDGDGIECGAGLELLMGTLLLLPQTLQLLGIGQLRSHRILDELGEPNQDAKAAHVQTPKKGET